MTRWDKPGQTPITYLPFVSRKRNFQYEGLRFWTSMTAWKERILWEVADSAQQKLQLLHCVAKAVKRQLRKYIYFLIFKKSPYGSWTKPSCDHLSASSALRRQTTRGWIWCSVRPPPAQADIPRRFLSEVVVIGLDRIADKATIILIIPMYMVLHLWMPNLSAILSPTHSAFCDLPLLVTIYISRYIS